MDAEKLIAAAQGHGEEEGCEAQIGDLEILFAAAFALLTDDQRSRFFADPGIAGLLDIYEYWPLRESLEGDRPP